MTQSASSGPRRKERVRCAIYTRKSSEEAPEQEFNSLQAQREASFCNGCSPPSRRVAHPR